MEKELQELRRLLKKVQAEKDAAEAELQATQERADKETAARELLAEELAVARAAIRQRQATNREIVDLRESIKNRLLGPTSSLEELDASQVQTKRTFASVFPGATDIYAATIRLAEAYLAEVDSEETDIALEILNYHLSLCRSLKNTLDRERTTGSYREFNDDPIFLDIQNKLTDIVERLSEAVNKKAVEDESEDEMGDEVEELLWPVAEMRNNEDIPQAERTIDTEFPGIRTIYGSVLDYCDKCLRKLQSGKSINSKSYMEIPIVDYYLQLCGKLLKTLRQERRDRMYGIFSDDPVIINFEERLDDICRKLSETKDILEKARDRSIEDIFSDNENKMELIT